ncbi:protocadherin-17 isoform X1 [Cuculus canorus]|uniref:protocadherin-17 isoform X1 n=1 Tax=Cuculus canorus TaxID=55661 RepID=UPI0023AB19D3|nr:protocadherin-17 isoform X1 [Cuculus canorus]XP_053930580.1 protocadherin-17 isoform X1 [Cuculus canorus]XP_053930583.1 protocadherin-17 isoform X1 [Cuculus canorus]
MYLSICCFFLCWAPALSLKNLNYSVPEEQGAGTVIGNIGRDARLVAGTTGGGMLPAERGSPAGGRGPKSTFRVLENSAPHLLDVDGESGLLYTKQRIDREALCRRSTKCQLSLEVFANDQEICMIKVEIQDLNDNAPTFPSDQVDMDISENAAPGTRFPLTSAHDPDAGDNGLRTYLLTRDDYGLFSLDVKSRGDGTKFPELVIQKPLDREEQSHHTLVLTALDGGDPPRSGTVQINVRLIDSNDNSPVFEAASYVVELPENAPLGTAVIDLNATDADEGTNGEVLYSFSGYAPERVRDLFSIDPQSGLIRVKGNLDYEESGLIEIDVQARDLGPNPIPAHCKVTVRLIDRNDNAPTIGFVSVRQGALSEAAPPGTVIALVRVTDRDSGKNGQLQCRVLGGGGGPGAVPFTLEENYDNFYTVVTDRPLDREAQDEYNVTIVARDGGNPPLNSTKSFSVRILDENDNPPRFSKNLYVLQVPENNIPGEYLGSVLAQDPDLGQNGTVSYSILPGHVGDVSIYTYVSVNPTNGAIYALRSFNYEQTKHFEFRVLAKDSGSPHRESNATVRVTVLDVNDNAPLIVLPALINDTAELQVPRNAGVGYPVGTVRALDSDFGESGRLTYEIVEGNEEHLFEMDPTSGEIRTLHPYWEELSPVAELVVKVSDHGKPSLSAVAKLIVRALAGPLPEAGEPQVNGEQHRRPHWDLSLPLIVTLSTVSIILLAAMITIAVKCKRENKEIRTYNCRIAEYSHPQLGGGGGSGGGGGGSGSGGGKGKKKKISKNDIMLVPSEGEDSRGPLNVMNVVSSPSLATSPMYFDYQTRLPLSSPRSEVMYLKPASNNLTVPQGHVGCHTSFTGQGTNASEAPPSRMSIIQTDNFPAEPNYMGSRQQFVQSSSTFKDPERASLRDSGHGDSDQADSDQDTNKGSCCDMSVREALKMKTTSTKSQPIEQEQKGRGQRPIVGICGPARCEDGKFSEQEECVNCTDECRVLGHSDRCWMPQFPAASQAENADYRTNLFVPTVEANVETETYETVNPTGKKTFCTFGKDKREHTILIANVKPYLKAKRALSPLLQEVPSASSSPTKTCIEPCTSTKGPLDGCEVKSGALAEPNSQYLSTDSQYLSPSKQSKDAPFIASDQMARAFADVHSRVSRDSSEMDSVLEQLDRSARDLGRESVDAEEVVREIDKLLQDCRGSDPVTVRK